MLFVDRNGHRPWSATGSHPAVRRSCPGTSAADREPAARIATGGTPVDLSSPTGSPIPVLLGVGDLTSMRDFDHTTTVSAENDTTVITPV